MKLSRAVECLGTEMAFHVLAEVEELRRQGRDILSFAIGELDFPTPAHIIEAAAQALRDGHTGYVASQGIIELREAIAESVAASRGVPVHPDQVVVFPSAKAALFHCILGAVERGAKALHPSPGFPTYASVIEYGGGQAIGVPLCEEQDFTPDLVVLTRRLDEKTSALILNSPHNPTGGVIAADDLRQILAAAAETPAWIIADEVYSELYFDAKPPSCMAVEGIRERLMLIDGFSKTYCMTGWRLGYAVLPADVVQPLVRFIVNTVSCTANFVQHAAIAAVRGPQDHIPAMRNELHARRDLIVDGLNALPGVSCRQPGGAFYVFPNVTGLCARLGCADAEELRRRLLHEAGVAVLDRGCFGAPLTEEREQYLRLSFACPRERIEAGMNRMARFVERAL